MGKCPDCGQWDSLVEETVAVGSLKSGIQAMTASPSEPVPIDSVEFENEERLQTHIQEFDRVLGGGLVPGSLVLIGGDPGIGKSTLMLQALFGLAQRGRKVLYVSGEESVRQLRLRSKRLAAVSTACWLFPNRPEAFLGMIARKQAGCSGDRFDSAMYVRNYFGPGSVSQVRESCMAAMVLARSPAFPRSGGALSPRRRHCRPRLLEHRWTPLLYFEGPQ
jgi:DNA repair protein RadA/Sms